MVGKIEGRPGSIWSGIGPAGAESGYFQRHRKGNLSFLRWLQRPFNNRGGGWLDSLIPPNNHVTKCLDYAEFHEFLLKVGVDLVVKASQRRTMETS